MSSLLFAVQTLKFNAFNVYVRDKLVLALYWIFGGQIMCNNTGSISPSSLKVVNWIHIAFQVIL
jgi:hypothetical protein